MYKCVVLIDAHFTLRQGNTFTVRIIRTCDLQDVNVPIYLLYRFSLVEKKNKIVYVCVYLITE